MSENVLPAVAKSVYTNCKKCEAERYHTVIAHVSATSAKVKCEICGAKKTFKLEKPEKKSAAKSEKKAEKKSGKTSVIGGTEKKTKRGIAAAEARKTAHTEEYNNLLATQSSEDVSAYNMKATFVVNSLVKHPKFGVGYVKVALPQKIEVIFEDEVRSLVHSRG